MKAGPAQAAGVHDRQIGPGGAISPWCPFRVSDPVMLHRWDELTFLHWSYEPDVVQRLLPPGLTVETFGGRAWVGLVPFAMQVTAPIGGPVPWVSRFCETNVRTYVVGPDGTTGVWFLSLDAARAGAVIVGRTVYDLPYQWARMRLHHVGSVVTYESRRRGPDARGARTEVAVRVGDQFAPEELGDADHWLTARWRLFSVNHRDGTIRYALAEHPPWPLHRAEVLHLDDELLNAAGLPAPVGDPLVHWSPGVAVRVTRLVPCATDDARAAKQRA